MGHVTVTITIDDGCTSGTRSLTWYEDECEGMPSESHVIAGLLEEEDLADDVMDAIVMFRDDLELVRKEEEDEIESNSDER